MTKLSAPTDPGLAEFERYGVPFGLEINGVYGWFRQRIFKFTYTDNYPMRIQDIEVDINKGTT